MATAQSQILVSVRSDAVARLPVSSPASECAIATASAALLPASTAGSTVYSVRQVTVSEASTGPDAPLTAPLSVPPNARAALWNPVTAEAAQALFDSPGPLAHQCPEVPANQLAFSYAMVPVQGRWTCPIASNANPLHRFRNIPPPQPDCLLVPAFEAVPDYRALVEALPQPSSRPAAVLVRRLTLLNTVPAALEAPAHHSSSITSGPPAPCPLHTAYPDSIQDPQRQMFLTMPTSFQTVVSLLSTPSMDSPLQYAQGVLASAVSILTALRPLRSAMQLPFSPNLTPWAPAGPYEGMENTPGFESIPVPPAFYWFLTRVLLLFELTWSEDIVYAFSSLDQAALLLDLLLGVRLYHLGANDADSPQDRFRGYVTPDGFYLTRSPNNADIAFLL